MKKAISILLVLGLLALTSTAFAAASSGSVQVGTMDLGDSTDTTKGLQVGLSPKIEGTYINAGTDAATSQWFAIGTMHPGGTKAYATAQNISNIWKMTFSAGTTSSTLFAKIPPTKASESLWSDNNWAK